MWIMQAHIAPTKCLHREYFDVYRPIVKASSKCWGVILCLARGNMAANSLCRTSRCFETINIFES